MNIKKAISVIPLSLSIILPFAGIASANDTPQPSVTTAAVSLRSTLDHLLSEHGYLAITAMRKGAEGAKDFNASVTALHQNTDDLSKAIASIYGQKTGVAFKQMWSEHVQYFVDYVVASNKNDKPGEQKALNNLSQYQSKFSQFLSNATGQRLEASALAKGLQEHVNQLITAFNDYKKGDYMQAYDMEDQALQHLYGVSKGLSNAIADQMPNKFNKTVSTTPAGNLRSQLNYLLSEHAGLAITAMQNGIDGSKDYKASVSELKKNTDKLSAAIASVYGQKAGNQFKTMWNNHISYFVDYVAATSKKDAKGKQAALDHLKQYRSDFSKFISSATNGAVPADALSAGLQTHVTQLIGAFNDYVNGDYTKEYQTVRDAYAHMFSPAKALSGAIVQQFPSKFMSQMPNDMPKTGMGPITHQPQDIDWIIIGALLLLAASTGTIAYMGHG